MPSPDYSPPDDATVRTPALAEGESDCGVVCPAPEQVDVEAINETLAFEGPGSETQDSSSYRPGGWDPLRGGLASGSPRRYRIGPVIGQGGVGDVHEGWDEQLDREVAIKVLRAELTDRPGLVQRFLEEARITGQLQHPGIVAIHELGVLPDGRPFFAMNLVKGETLRRMLADRRGPSDDFGMFLSIFEKVCDAVAYAHDRGDPPRPEVGESHGRPVRAGPRHGLGRRQGAARDRSAGPAGHAPDRGDLGGPARGMSRRPAISGSWRPSSGRSSAPRRTWPPSRPAGRSTASIGGRTCSAWAASSARSSRASRLTRAPTRGASSPRPRRRTWRMRSHGSMRAPRRRS